MVIFTTPLSDFHERDLMYPTKIQVPTSHEGNKWFHRMPPTSIMQAITPFLSARIMWHLWSWLAHAARKPVLAPPPIFLSSMCLMAPGVWLRSIRDGMCEHVFFKWPISKVFNISKLYPDWMNHTTHNTSNIFHHVFNFIFSIINITAFSRSRFNCGQLFTSPVTFTLCNQSYTIQKHYLLMVWILNRI